MQITASPLLIHAKRRLPLLRLFAAAARCERQLLQAVGLAYRKLDVLYYSFANSRVFHCGAPEAAGFAAAIVWRKEYVDRRQIY